MVRLLTRKRGFYILILNCLIDTYNKYLEPGYPGLIVEAWRDLEPEIFEWWVEVLKLTRPKVYLMRFICFCHGLHWFTIVYLDLACIFNVYSLSIQCTFNVYSIYIYSIFYVSIVYFEANDSYSLTPTPWSNSPMPYSLPFIHQI